MDDQPGGHTVRDDPWMSTVTGVSAFLAGFSLASVVVIADGPEHFRWPGVAMLALTTASVLLILTAQGPRDYWERYRAKWRPRLWAAYRVGIFALLVGFGSALAPLEGAAGKPGVAGQEELRWAAVSVAFAAALGEVLVGVGFWVKFWMNRRLAEVLDLRVGWHCDELPGERAWCFGVGGAVRLVIVPEMYGFLMYRVNENVSVARSIKSVKEWLEANEQTLAGPAPQVNCQEAIKQARAGRKGQVRGQTK